MAGDLRLRRKSLSQLRQPVLCFGLLGEFARQRMVTLLDLDQQLIERGGQLLHFAGVRLRCPDAEVAPRGDGGHHVGES